jgi:hypothetical protein
MIFLMTFNNFFTVRNLISFPLLSGIGFDDHVSWGVSFFVSSKIPEEIEIIRIYMGNMFFDNSVRPSINSNFQV